MPPEPHDVDDLVDDEERAAAAYWRSIADAARELGHYDVAVVQRGARFYYRCACIAGVVPKGGHKMPGLSRLSWATRVGAALMARRHLVDSVTQSQEHDRALGVSGRKRR